MRKYLFATALITAGLIGSAYAQPSTNGPSGNGPEGSPPGAPVNGSGLNPPGSFAKPGMSPSSVPSPTQQTKQKDVSPSSTDAGVKQEK